MTVEITIRDDAGKIQATITGDAAKPGQWKSPYDRPLDTGQYNVFGFSYVPITVLKPLSPTK